jgi:peptide methionine sulfoxide reductase MsrB
MFNSKQLSVPAIGRGDESLMSPKAHGTTDKPPQPQLRYGCDHATADKICCFNRHYAEHRGYFQTTKWLEEVDPGVVTTYYDSVTGKPLFKAPIGRTFEEFKQESISHGWPSFRDEEVVWENMRVLENGESVSVDGTHLGHNLPDKSGNRYCINLVCVAGDPVEGQAGGESADAADAGGEA